MNTASAKSQFGTDQNVSENSYFEQAQQLAADVWSGSANDAVYFLRAQMGRLADQSAPFISDGSQKGYRSIEKGHEQKITIEFLKNHPDFKPQERQKALKIHELLQAAIHQKEVTPTQADELMENYLTNKIGVEFIQGALQFAKEYLEMANKLMAPVYWAKEEGYISETDIHYYQKEYIAKNEFTLRKDFMAIQLKIDRKLKNRKKGKELYKAKMKHPAVQARLIKLGGAMDLLFDEKKFLEATVPDRKAFYKALVETLEVWDKQTQRYKTRLNQALAAGWINPTTYNHFLNGKYKETRREEDRGFNEIDIQTRETWINDTSVLGLRADLRKNINQMKGGAKQYMERMFYLVGYTHLSKIYEHDQALQKDYIKALDGYLEKGQIGKKTHQEYAQWIEAQPLYLKKQALSLLPGYAQMGRFAQLTNDIKSLTPEQKLKLEMKHDEWGYTQKREFIKWAQQQNSKTIEITQDHQPDELQELARAQIGDAALADATAQMVDDLTNDEVMEMINLLDKIKKADGSVNSFGETMKAARREEENQALFTSHQHNESLVAANEAFYESAANEVSYQPVAHQAPSAEDQEWDEEKWDEEEFEADLEVMEENEKAEVLEFKYFKQVKTQIDGEEATANRVVLSDTDSRKRFFSSVVSGHNSKEDALTVHLSVGGNTKSLDGKMSQFEILLREKRAQSQRKAA